ncbi:caspase family protein [Bradyrhizobium sp.]|uniref:caspase family protein n=1 Tax=Bradyrhizobium sp. TaxID=376 RepID=UPI00403834BB
MGKAAVQAALVVALVCGSFATSRSLAQTGNAQSGCRTGPYANTAALEDRIAACTLIIEGRAQPAKLAQALFARGVAYLDNRQCDAAIADLERGRDMVASKKDGTHNNFLIWLGFYWQYCKGDYERAIVVLGDATRIFPRDPSAYNVRSQVYTEKGNYVQALADINRAIGLVNNDQNRASTHNGRAGIYKKVGDYDKALADYSVAIRLMPKNPKYHANRGEIHRLTGNLERALADQDRAIVLYEGGPGVALGFVLRGETLRYMGDYDRALSDFNAAIRSEPGYAPAYVGRGLTFERSGDFERAKSEFRMALQVSENVGRSDISKAARDTAEARLAALSSGVEQPKFLPVPPRAASVNSVPTPQVTTPAVAPAVARATAAKQGRRIALVIGNSAYKSVPVLENPRRDAEKVAAALRGIGFDSVTLMTDATREKAIEALRSFAASADKTDWAMVYYAGHGIEVNGVNYLVPVDARLASDRDVLFEAVPLDQVMGAIDGARKLKLVMLDACRDNPFAGAAAANPSAPALVQASAVAEDGTRSARTRSAGRGLGEVKVSGASLVVYAAKHGQTALDGEGENSPFAVAVVQRMATPGVEINKLFRLVRDDVMEATAGRQEPYTYGSLPGREDFFFVTR